MRLLLVYLTIIVIPLCGYSQNHYSPLGSYFNSDGRSIYGEMSLDSIDVLNRTTSAVKVSYYDDCRVQSIRYLNTHSGIDSNHIKLEYHDEGLLKSRFVLRVDDTGLSNYDSTWYNTKGRIIKTHNINSTQTYERLIKYTYDEQGRLLKYYISSLTDIVDNYQYQESKREYSYIADNQIAVDESLLLIYRIENNPIDTIISESTSTYYYDNNRITERITESDGAIIRYNYKYEGDILLEIVTTYNGNIRNKTVYSYSDTIPECNDWTNDLWEAELNQKVETITYYDSRHLELLPHEESITAKNAFGKTTYSQRKTADAFGNWNTIQKSLSHYDENGGSKYRVIFDQNTNKTAPRWLYIYETNSDLQITKAETYSYIPETETWSELESEQINAYNSNGDLISRIVTSDDGQDFYSWEYTDFGGLSRTTSPDWDSKYYYSKRCENTEPEQELSLVYPNPVSNILHFSEFDPEKVLSVKIFSANGALISNYASVDNGRIDVSYLTSGAYFLSYTKGAEVKHLQFIKL